MEVTTTNPFPTYYGNCSICGKQTCDCWAGGYTSTSFNWPTLTELTNQQRQAARLTEVWVESQHEPTIEHIWKAYKFFLDRLNDEILK